jgi:hypothetical protein
MTSNGTRDGAGAWGGGAPFTCQLDIGFVVVAVAFAAFVPFLFFHLSIVAIHGRGGPMRSSILSR